MQPDQEVGNELESVLAQAKEIALSQEQTVLTARRESLTPLMNAIRGAIQNFAQSHHLQWSQTGHSVSATADESWTEDHLSVEKYGGEPSFAAYRVEFRGAGEYVVLVDGVEVWRGGSVDQPLADAITLAAGTKFLSEAQRACDEERAQIDQLRH